MAVVAGSKGVNPPRPLVHQDALGAGSKGIDPPRPTLKVKTRK